ncbi:MAG TPA: FHA domain-containing protein [Anaeromyxobacter sp.]|nr:FHA domain-containing protein [Anaeromyxobacter sp.]
MKCKSCGAEYEVSLSRCPACDAEVEFGRLTGILGVVCRRCDVYNEPGTKVCVGCGQPLGGPTPQPPPPVQGAAPAAPADPAPRVQPVAPAAPAPRPAPQGSPSAPAVTRAGSPNLPPGQPVVRSFQRASPGATVAARRSPPVALVARCPRCGAPASVGTFCPSCGQALGSRGTQVMAPVGALPDAVPTTYAKLAPGRARLVLERGAGKEGAVFRLDAEVTEVGRSRGAIVFPDDPTLAAHHASFVFRNGSLHLRDEGAPGGIHLRLRGLSIPLKPGDHLVTGDHLLRYAGPLPPAAPPPPDGTRRLGAPRPGGPAIVLEEILEGGVTGRVFVRPGPSVTVGRAGCAVNLGDDPYLSQAHAELVVDAAGGVRLRDLGSSNGTFVRLPSRTERELRDADVVRMGREVLRVAVVDG